MLCVLLEEREEAPNSSSTADWAVYKHFKWKWLLNGPRRPREAFSSLFIAANREMMSLDEELARTRFYRFSLARKYAVDETGLKVIGNSTDWLRLHLSLARLTCNNNIYAQLLESPNHLRWGVKFSLLLSAFCGENGKLLFCFVQNAFFVWPGDLMVFVRKWYWMAQLHRSGKLFALAYTPSKKEHQPFDEKIAQKRNICANRNVLTW